MFTKEELLKWGLTEQQILELDWESEVYLQWKGCPQGLAPAAPAFNIHLAHGFNTALKELWRKMWILYIGSGFYENVTRGYGYES